MVASASPYHASECVRQEPYLWPAGPPMTWEQERDDIGAAMAKGQVRQVNQPFFVVSFPWLSSWREYASGGGKRPPPINNSDLLEENKVASIRKGIAPNYDYEIVPGPVWQRLHAWYGGGPSILRRVVRSGTLLMVDLYPVTITFKHEQNLVTTSLASNNTGRMMRHWLATKVNAPPGRAEVGIVKTDANGTRQVVFLKEEELRRTMEEMGLVDSVEVELRIAAQEANYSSFVSSGVGSAYAMKPLENEIGTPTARGVVGLHNLGNTCFLNSTLQCLSAVPPLVSLFYHDAYKQLVNAKGNPMSSKGELSEAMHHVMRDMWSGVFRTVAPNAFKKVLSQWAPQFRGYQQHDAQEALLVMLNLLHEDLCNLQSKAAVIAAASAGGPVALAASPIASLFGGTYRSELTCDTCGQKSVVYEPFLNFPLPVPEKEHRKLAVTFFPLAGRPVHLGVRVNKTGNARHIFSRMADVLGLPGLEARVAGLQLSGHSGVFEMGEQKMVGSFRDADRALVFEQVGEEGWRTVMVFSFTVPSHGHQRAAVCGVPVAVSVKVTDSGQQALERARDKIASIVGVSAAAMTVVDVRIVKFNGPLEESSEVPLRSTLTASCLAFVWSRDTAEMIAKSYEHIAEDPSCKPNAEDKEMTVPLRDCFTMAGAPESMSLGEGWKCPSCKEARSAVKIMSLWRAPPVLCLQLKRFKMDFVTREKLHTLVTFPLALNMAEFVAGPEVPLGEYQLVGVCNHVGGLSGGHYTAFGKVGGEWYDFNDRNCSPISEEKIVTCSAYVLYYVHHSALDVYLEPVLQADVAAATQAAAIAAAAEASSSGSKSTGSGMSASGTAKAQPASASAPKKVKSEDSDTSCDMNVSHSPPRAAYATHHQSPQQHVPSPAVKQDEEVNLSDSQYLCDICSAGVQGGWAGLTRHARDVHGVEY